MLLVQGYTQRVEREHPVMWRLALYITFLFGLHLTSHYPAIAQ